MPKVGSNIVSPHFSTQNQDICHDTIGSSMIQIQSQDDQTQRDRSSGTK